MQRVSLQSILQFIVLVALLVVVGVSIQPQDLSGQSLGAPPVPRFLDETGRVLITPEQIVRGQRAFIDLKTDTTSFNPKPRHPDTLDELKRLMHAYHAGQRPDPVDAGEAAVRTASIDKRVGLELGFNHYDPVSDAVTLIESQIAAFYGFIAESSDNALPQDLAAYRFWSAWIRGVDRPAYDTSYRALQTEAAVAPVPADDSERLLVPILIMIGLAVFVGVIRSLAKRGDREHAWA